MKALAFAVMVSAAASAAFADSDHRKGTEGLSPLDYAIQNTGANVLSCDVKLAHWYSDHLATIAPQAQGGFTLWADDATGAVYLMNDAGDRMPVERLWCGLDGRSWETRHEIDLARRAGALATATALRCAANDAGTDCR